MKNSGAQTRLISGIYSILFPEFLALLAFTEVYVERSGNENAFIGQLKGLNRLTTHQIPREVKMSF
jgi:hypothetical protein